MEVIGYLAFEGKTKTLLIRTVSSRNVSIYKYIYMCVYSYIHIWNPGISKSIYTGLIQRSQLSQMQTKEEWRQDNSPGAALKWHYHRHTCKRNNMITLNHNLKQCTIAKDLYKKLSAWHVSVRNGDTHYKGMW